MIDKIRAGIFGLCVGDAVGVPFEFSSRESRVKNPANDMVGYGTHNQPKGTWSDDSTMTLCLADSIAECGIIDYNDIMKRFLLWADKAEYTPYNEVFDMGIATNKAITKFKHGSEPLECGGKGVYDNGNGAIMRILPISYYIYKKYGVNFYEHDTALKEIENTCSITHAHPISIISCVIYVAIAVSIIDCGEIYSSDKVVNIILEKYKNKSDFSNHISGFERIKNFNNFKKTESYHIKSSGYVLHTLEASIWCILNSSSYRQCVLTAVNLGDDTDTTAAVCGGLAGIIYGYASIPKEWIESIARQEWIEEICSKLYRSISNIL